MISARLHIPLFVLYCAATPFAAAEEAQDAGLTCGKRVAVEGFVRPSTALAELSAIQKWLEAVAASEPERAVWHRAQGQTIKCEAIGSIGSVHCTAVATPCSASVEDDLAE